MSSRTENESEILLGNKQLLAIFFVIAILLGIAFTGGYMVGRGSQTASQAATSPDKKPLAATPNSTDGERPPDSAIETHPVGPAGSAPQDTSKEADSSSTSRTATPNPPPLGSRKEKAAAKAPAPDAPAPSSTTAEGYTPQSGQMFLQVVALARDDAYGVAEVLSKKGFRAHAVPKPGNTKLYRVLVGPIRDTADLSSTRDALRKTGFQDVILQRY